MNNLRKNRVSSNKYKPFSNISSKNKLKYLMNKVMTYQHKIKLSLKITLKANSKINNQNSNRISYNLQIVNYKEVL